MEKFYDLKILSKGDLPIDMLIKLKRPRYMGVYYKPNRIWPMFNDITPVLVKDFSQHARNHILYIKEDHKRDNPKYDYLYFLAKENYRLFNSVYLYYGSFPLMVEKNIVLEEIRKLAKGFSNPHTNEFDATCLYLIYFYALLVNENSNWITMDYISNGNRYHQHATRLDREMETKTQRFWKE